MKDKAGTWFHPFIHHLHTFPHPPHTYTAFGVAMSTKGPLLSHYIDSMGGWVSDHTTTTYPSQQSSLFCLLFLLGLTLLFDLFIFICLSHPKPKLSAQCLNFSIYLGPYNALLSWFFFKRNVSQSLLSHSNLDYLPLMRVLFHCQLEFPLLVSCVQTHVFYDSPLSLPQFTMSFCWSIDSNSFPRKNALDKNVLRHFLSENVFYPWA